MNPFYIPIHMLVPFLGKSKEQIESALFRNLKYTFK